MIVTKTADGQRNGYLVPLWNRHEQDWRPDQVYVTVIDVGCMKGPHLHKRRCGRFVCIAGNVEVIMRRRSPTSAITFDGTGNAIAEQHEIGLFYERHKTGDDHDHALIEVPPGVPAQIRNIDSVPAFVINMPSPAWKPDDQDEWPVEDWNP